MEPGLGGSYRGRGGRWQLLSFERRQGSVHEYLQGQMSTRALVNVPEECFFSPKDEAAALYERLFNGGHVKRLLPLGISGL